jgi:hypothetical protein
VIGGGQPKMLRVTARHANEWNWADTGSLEEWLEASSRLDEACDEIGRDPREIRRSVQLFLFPRQPGQIDVQIDRLPEYEKLGCQHVVFSFYQPPSIEILERCANLD